jgi:putative oxidoreductase
MILVGLFTRPVAFLLCGEMAVAYFRAPFPDGYFPIRNGGELAVLYCFIYLFLSTAGPGPISLDGLRGKA